MIDFRFPDGSGPVRQWLVWQRPVCLLVAAVEKAAVPAEWVMSRNLRFRFFYVNRNGFTGFCDISFLPGIEVTKRKWWNFSDCSASGNNGLLKGLGAGIAFILLCEVRAGGIYFPVRTFGKNRSIHPVKISRAGDFHGKGHRFAYFNINRHC